MNLEQQKEVINLYKRYQDTERNIIKINLKAQTDKAKLKPLDIAKNTRIPVQTIYQVMFRMSRLWHPYPSLVCSLPGLWHPYEELKHFLHNSSYITAVA